MFHVLDDVNSGRQPTTVLWRLIAANGRELARAAYPSDGFYAARDAVLAMQASIGRGHLSALCRLGEDGQWSWLVEVSGTAATGHHSRKEVDCQAALDRFLAIAPKATLAHGCTARRVGARAQLLRDRSAMSLSLAGPIGRAS